MAAFCRLKPPRVNKPPSAKDITDRQRRSHKSVVNKKKKKKERKNYITSVIIISLIVTKQNQIFISVSFLCYVQS